MPNVLGLTLAPPTRRATSSAWPPVSRASSSRLAAAAEDDQRAARQPDDGRRRHSPHPIGVRAGHQPRPHADHLGGANEIEFVGPPGAQRELPRKLYRIRANPVVGRDSAQGAQPCVKRRCVAGGEGGLSHRQLLSRAAGVGGCALASSVRRIRTGTAPSPAQAWPPFGKAQARSSRMAEQTYPFVEELINPAAWQRIRSDLTQRFGSYYCHRPIRDECKPNTDNMTSTEDFGTRRRLARAAPTPFPIGSIGDLRRRPPAGGGVPIRRFVRRRIRIGRLGQALAIASGRGVERGARADSLEAASHAPCAITFTSTLPRVAWL